MAITATEIQALYVAYFNRPADVLGLSFWVDRANASPNGLAQVANEFSNSDEYRALYANKEPAAIVDAIYVNLFGRHAEAEGLVYWAKKLINKELNIGNVALIISQSAQNEDLVAITAKVSAAESFTNSLTDAAEIIGYSGDAANAIAKTWLAGITDDATLAAATTDAALQAVSDSAVAAHDGVVNAGKSLTLTKSVDSGAAFTGGAGVDTFNGVIDNDGTTNNSTFTALDDLKGGAGVDILNIDVIDDNGAGLPVVTLTSIETVNIRSAVASLTADLSSQADVATINVTKGVAVNLTASSTAAVNVSGTTGAVDVNGGASQNIVAEGADVTSGTAATAADDTKGNVTINVAKVDAHDIVVTGGKDVSVTTTGATAGNTINIGQGTQQATGAVKVSVTGAAYDKADAGPSTFGGITVKGGTSIEVTQVAYASTADAVADNSNQLRTQGAVSIDGAGTATTVTVSQTKAVGAKNGFVAVDGINQAATYTFTKLLAGQSAAVGGLTFTAVKDLTAEEVATAFANLADGAVQAGGVVANGSYTGTFAADWTSGAVSGATVVFTALDPHTAAASALAPTVNAVPLTAASTVAGKDKTDAVTGVAGVAGGAVTITDSGATDKIATVKLDGYATASSIASEALTTLNVANSAGTLAITQSTQKSLDLTVNALATGASVVAPTYETVTLHVAGASTFGLQATAAKALVVDGSALANISGATGVATTFGNLETVTVTGTAGLNLANNASGTLKSVDTTGTTGTVTVSIDGTKATYSGGEGVDNVTLISSTAITKAINLGGGNDTLTFTGTTVPGTGGTIDGGTGTNTLALTSSDAAALSLGTTFEGTISNFQKLSLAAPLAGATDTVDLSNLDDISYVISANAPAAVLAAQEVQNFTVTSGVTAAKTNQTKTLDFTGMAVTADGNITVAGVAVAVVGADTATTIATKVQAALNGVTANGSGQTVVASRTGNIVTITYDTRDTVGTALVVADATATTTGKPVEVAGTAYGANAQTITIGGVAVGLDAQDKTAAGAVVAGSGDDTVGEVATKIVAGLDVNVTYDAAGTLNTGAAVTVKYAANGDVSNIALAATTSGVAISAITETTKGVTAAGAGGLIINKMANGGTLELTAAGAGVTVNLTDVTGTSDSLNVKLAAATNTGFGTVTAAGVESIALNLDDTSTKAADITAVHTVAIADTALKSLVLTGDAGGIVTTNSNVLATIDGSALTLSLTAGSLTTATVAATITGGAGDDKLTANHTGDKLIGGAGDDTLVVGGASGAVTPIYANGITLTGGAGADTFDISGAGSVVATVNDYATITDFSAGDVLKLSASNLKFVAAVVATGSTAVFQDLVNKFIKESATNDAGWFQFNGDTYVVEHRGGVTTTFTNGTDNIVKITGQIDLSHATSYSNTADTLLVIG
jgi:hypothetical protein